MPVRRESRVDRSLGGQVTHAPRSEGRAHLVALRRYVVTVCRDGGLERREPAQAGVPVGLPVACRGRLGVGRRADLPHTTSPRARRSSTSSRRASCAEYPAASCPGDGAGPHPSLVLVRWYAEADVDGPRRPGDRVSDDELLDAVLPDDPGRDSDRFRRRGHAGLGELLRRQGPRMPRFASVHIGHLGDDIEHRFDRGRCPLRRMVPTGRVGADVDVAIMLPGLDAILSGQTAHLPNGVQRYPRQLEARVARALATGSVGSRFRLWGTAPTVGPERLDNPAGATGRPRHRASQAVPQEPSAAGSGVGRAVRRSAGAVERAACPCSRVTASH